MDEFRPSSALEAVLGHLHTIVESIEVANDSGPTSFTRPASPQPIGEELALTIGDDQEPLSLDWRFDWVCELLQLDSLECAVLAVCVLPELSRECAQLLAVLQQDAGTRSATPRLAGRLLTNSGVTVADVLVCFDEGARLRTSGALRLGPDGPLADRAVEVGPSLVCHLLGSRLVEIATGAEMRRVEAVPGPLGRTPEIRRLATVVGAGRDLPVAAVKADAISALAAIDAGVLVVDAARITDPAVAADLALTAILEQRVPAVDGFGSLSLEDGRRAAGRAARLPCRPVLIFEDRAHTAVLADITAHIVELPPPTFAERVDAWQAVGAGEMSQALAQRYRLSITAIGQAADHARTEASAAGEDEVSADRWWAGARAASSRGLAEVAELLTPGPLWDDLVLPAAQTTSLHAMASFLAHRTHVLDDWGYRRIAGDRGLTALFAGESGTGKTMAARVMAAACGLEVYRVDLSGLFSKWVGETEKNLDRIFSAGQSGNAILFFDEADIVFGRRGEAGDANNRYANLETAFLLQRIESYEGVVVLATNLRNNMDDAFIRRLDMVIDFPPPDEPTRRRLWRTLLPPQAPLEDDIDLDFLAARFELSGGGIRNCSLAAALLAAEEGGAIGMRHLVRAVAMEYAKLGRLTVEADFGDFHGIAQNGDGA